MTGRPRAPGGRGGDGNQRGRRARGGAHSVDGGHQQVRQAAQGGRPRITAPNWRLQPRVITLRWESSMPRLHFIRKAKALFELGNQGKLYKATNPVERDPSVTGDWKSRLIQRAYRMFGSGPRADHLRDLVRRHHADHLHELQLGGPDHPSNLILLDPHTNTEIGLHQIRPQIRNLPDGTPILIRIVGPPDIGEFVKSNVPSPPGVIEPDADEIVRRFRGGRR